MPSRRDVLATSSAFAAAESHRLFHTGAADGYIESKEITGKRRQKEAARRNGRQRRTERFGRRPSTSQLFELEHRDSERRRVVGWRRERAVVSRFCGGRMPNQSRRESSAASVFPFGTPHWTMTWRELFERADGTEMDLETIRRTLAERRDE